MSLRDFRFIGAESSGLGRPDDGTAARRASLPLTWLPASFLCLQGMERFRRGEVEKSCSDFDKAVRLQPSLAPYMWQRGLSLYYGEMRATTAAPAADAPPQ